MATTWNPSDKSTTITLSNGDLTATANVSASYWVRATTSMSSGKLYWEVEIDWQYQGNQVGIGNASAGLDSHLGADANSWCYESQGSKRHNNSGVSTGFDSFTTGDIIGVALDLDSGKVWFAKNNSWQDSGDPANGTGEAYSGISGSIFPMSQCKGKPGGAGDSQTIIPDSGSQTYSPPSGFTAWDDAGGSPSESPSEEPLEEEMCTLDYAIQPGATTQYSNFLFNSMVKFGDTYVGANSNGIYELDGDDDDGTNIDAEFEPITTDFGLENPKWVRFMYFGYEADGDLVIVLSADQGVGETISIDSDKTRQQRKRVSGVRSIQGKYISFGIANTSGCDFGIDSIDVDLVVMPQGLNTY